MTPPFIQERHRRPPTMHRRIVVATFAAVLFTAAVAVSYTAVTLIAYWVAVAAVNL